MSGLRNLRTLYVTIRGSDPSPSMFVLPRARRWMDTTATTKARWYAAVSDLRNLRHIVANVEIIVKFRVPAFIQAHGDHADVSDIGWVDTKLRMRSRTNYMPSTAHTLPEVVSEEEITTTNGTCVNPTSLASRVISMILAYAAIEERPLPGQWLVEEGYNLLRPLQLSCRRMRLEVRAEARLLLRNHFLSGNTFRFSDFAELGTVARFAPVKTLAAVERIRIENFTFPGPSSTAVHLDLQHMSQRYQEDYKIGLQSFNGYLTSLRCLELSIGDIGPIDRDCRWLEQPVRVREDYYQSVAKSAASSLPFIPNGIEVQAHGRLWTFTDKSDGLFPGSARRWVEVVFRFRNSVHDFFLPTDMDVVREVESV
jgi:hypothetical protein